MSICGQPVIDFNGGAVLTLHITRLLCEDETEHEGFWPFQGEGIANDAMRLGGVVTFQVGASGIPQQCELQPQDLGNDYQDNTAVSLDREIYRAYITASGRRPFAAHALILLVEEDWGGLEWDDTVKKVIEGVGTALKSGVSAAVGAAVGAGVGTTLGPIGTAIGTGVGAFAGWVVGEISNAVKSTQSDVFPPGETSFMIGSDLQPASFTQHLRFQGHGGQYLLTVEWRLRLLPKQVEKVAFQAHNGQFVVAPGGGRTMLMAMSPKIQAWETFGLIRLTSNRVALMASNGDFVCAENGGGRELVANRPHIREWETFRLEDLGGNQVALRANNGQYVAAENGGGLNLVANRVNRSIWETFTMHKVLTEVLAPVIVYKHENYGDPSQVLAEGRYDLDAFAFGNDAITSVKVPKGWKVTLYDDWHFTGATRVLTGDTPNLQDFNDRTSSIKVERS